MGLILLTLASVSLRYKVVVRDSCEYPLSRIRTTVSLMKKFGYQGPLGPPILVDSTRLDLTLVYRFLRGLCPDLVGKGRGEFTCEKVICEEADKKKILLLMIRPALLQPRHGNNFRPSLDS